METDSPATEMTVDECWDFLAAHELGRLAFRLIDDLFITPINYAVDGRTLLFRTAPGNKLFGVELGGKVAFEVDEVTGEHATSVVIRGRARHLDEHDEHRAEVVRLHAWLDTAKYNVVEISPEEITGRSYALYRPWLHERVDV